MMFLHLQQHLYRQMNQQYPQPLIVVMPKISRIKLSLLSLVMDNAYTLISLVVEVQVLKNLVRAHLQKQLVLINSLATLQHTQVTLMEVSPQWKMILSVQLRLW